MQSRTFDLKKQNNMFGRIIGVTVFLLFLTILFYFTDSNDASPEIGREAALFVGLVFVIALIPVYLVAIITKNEITFTDTYIAVNFRKNKYKIDLQDNLIMELSGIWALGRYRVALNILPMNIYVKDLDSSIIKYIYEYCEQHKIKLYVSDNIQTHIGKLLQKADSSGELDNLYEFSISNFIYWIKRPSTTYNYSLMVGDEGTGKRSDLAPIWVVFFGILVFSVIISAIFSVLIFIKDKNFSELPKTIVTFTFSAYVIGCILFLLIPAFVMYVLRLFKNFSNADTPFEKALSMIRILVTFTIVLLSAAYLKHQWDVESEAYSRQEEINNSFKIKIPKDIKMPKIVVPKIQ